jgi:hypothetical protein
MKFLIVSKSFEYQQLTSRLSTLLIILGLDFGFVNDVSQQFVSDILCELDNVYVGIESGNVTHVASLRSLSAIARESGNGIK